MGGFLRGILGVKDAPATPTPIKPQAPIEGATFRPGAESDKKAKKASAIKKGKGRLAISLKSGTKSGVNRGY